MPCGFANRSAEIGWRGVRIFTRSCDGYPAYRPDEYDARRQSVFGYRLVRGSDFQQEQAGWMGKAKKNDSGANLGFEAKLWLSACEMRNMDAAEYKHLVLGLIFLKYISDAFKEHYRMLFPDSFEDSSLGRISKGWEIASIGDVVRAVGGGTPSTKEPAYWENGVHHWATPKDLSSLSFPILLDTERRITNAGLRKISSGLLPPGTLLLSSRAPIGYLAIAQMLWLLIRGL